MHKFADSQSLVSYHSFIKGIETRGTRGEEEELTKCLAVGLTQAAKFITGNTENLLAVLQPHFACQTERQSGHRKRR